MLRRLASSHQTVRPPSLFLPHKGGETRVLLTSGSTASGLAARDSPPRTPETPRHRRSSPACAACGRARTRAPWRETALRPRVAVRPDIALRARQSVRPRHCCDRPQTGGRRARPCGRGHRGRRERQGSSSAAAKARTVVSNDIGALRNSSPPQRGRAPLGALPQAASATRARRCPIRSASGWARPAGSSRRKETRRRREPANCGRRS